jgi:uncharacterized protein YukE
MPLADSTPIAVPAELAAAGTFINTRAAQIAAELHKLIRLLLPLQESWDGWTAGYYDGLQAEWNISAEGLFGPNGILGQIAHAMHVNWSNYSDAEWSNQQTWAHRR